MNEYAVAFQDCNHQKSEFTNSLLASCASEYAHNIQKLFPSRGTLTRIFAHVQPVASNSIVICPPLLA